ncbi:protein cop [Staphylococcus aureus]|nr:protein cop [Staphylococcus aureus]RMC23546.1 protein cop [Staphylococcus aureus]
MFFTSHLKRYINRYEKATFFALKTSHTNNLRVTSLAGNSYPYYQDKKKLVFNSFQKPFKNHQSTKIPRE